jgi:hypothetical protein
MNILQIILMECDLKSPTTIPNYRLFSEEEKNEMRKYNGPLPGDNLCVEEMEGSDELPGLRAMPTVERLRRIARLIPMPVLEPHGEDVMEEKCSEEYLEEAKAAVEICREELEQQIMEHLMKESNDR